MESLTSWGAVDSYTVPARLVPVQTFLVHKIRTIERVYKDEDLNKK